MKTFTEYLTESAKQFKYKIKLAGEYSPEFFSNLKMELDRYSLFSFSEPKKTPIMPTLPGFPADIKNKEMTSVDVVFHYPASEDQIRALCVKVGCDIDCVKVVTQDYADSCEKEQELKSKNSIEGGSLLNSSYPESTKEEMDANAEYGESYVSRAKSEKSTNHLFSKPNTEKLVTTNDFPQNKTSPISGEKNVKK